MLNAFDYENMWKGFHKEYGIRTDKSTNNIGNLMNQYKKDYIKRNKNILGRRILQRIIK